MKRALYTSLILLAACGGGGNGASGGTKTAADAKKAEPHESIGDLAASQGGISALGGNGNREEGSTGVESAFGSTLHIDDTDRKQPVKLDGVLKEWPARVNAEQAITGKTDGLSLAVAVQADSDRIFVGAEITDPQPARTAAHNEADSHVSFVIAFPAGRGGLKAYEIGFFPGKPGESSGAVKWLAGPSKGQNVEGAKIVESDPPGAGKTGFVFEAALPWSSFPEARLMRVGMRGALRYHNYSSSAVIGTGGGGVDHPNDLAALPSPAEQAVVEGLLGPKNLAGTAPHIDVFADVAGDERKERISAFGKFFTICGPGYRGGKQFFWREVQGELSSFETRELTGRGKDDMIVRRRLNLNGVVHELLEVWTVASANDEPTTIFTQEISIADKQHRVANAVRIAGREIEVSVEPAQGWDAASFHEPTNGEEGILLPWGAVKSRTFHLEKGRFVKASEVAQGGAAAPAPTPEVPRDQPAPTPSPSKSGDLSRQVMDQYLKDQSVPAGTKPKFDLEVHVDGDARPERVALIGRDIVVLGPGFKGGTGYARMSLTQFSDDKDVSELTARDMTGDGAAELVVRGVRHVTTPQGDNVAVDGLFVYQVKGGAIARVFAIETGRELSGKRVQGQVQMVPSKTGKGFDIDVRPGVARGWTQATYPWPQDRPGSGAIEPLLLPWGGITSMHYAWNGSQFASK